MLRGSMIHGHLQLPTCFDTKMLENDDMYIFLTDDYQYILATILLSSIFKDT